MRGENENVRMLAVVVPLVFGAFLLGHGVGTHGMREEMWRASDRCRELLRARCADAGEEVQPPARFDLGDSSGDTTP